MAVRTLGVLLAGGQGRRLGLAKPKALVPVAGRTLLEHALGIMGPLCDERLVCAPAAIELPPIDAIRVHDPGLGPLAALVAALGRRAFDRALVLGVDLPRLQVAALAALGGRLGRASAVVPVPGTWPQPLAMWLAPAAASALAAKFDAGERALVPAVLSIADLDLVQEEALARLPGGVEAFLNVNTPADLAEAERRFVVRRGA